jgi:phosphatidate cytidylyltransferase
MSYPDAPDDSDGRPSRRRRGSRPARPAWDAATYGRPDDVRVPPPPPEPEPVARSWDFGSTGPTDTPYESPAETPYENTSPYEDKYESPYRSTSPADFPGGADLFPGGAGAYQEEPVGRHAATGQRLIESPVTAPATETELTPASFPGGAPETPPGPAPRAARTTGRTGRNMPAAIGIGVLLGAVVLLSLFLWRPAFLGVIAIAVGVGSWELVRAIRTSGAQPPLVPLVAGGVLMVGLAWWGQGDALTFGLIVTVLAAMVWRLADGAGGYGRDVTAATLIATYLPFLGGFVALLALPPDGDLRVVAMLAGVVLSDTGGFIAGVLFGKHPMAPRVSPKKSWEGLAGSMVAGAVGGAVLLGLMFGVAVWWGALFGMAVSAAATVGDLGESMLKRDLGVKDMSNLLPGHGGLMDRLDSVLLAAPTAYALLTLLAPVG